MSSINYVGMDVHKKTITYCVKLPGGEMVDQGSITTSHAELQKWADSLDRPWIGAMEATMFTGWIYDFLRPYAMRPVALRSVTGMLYCADPDTRPEAYIALPQPDEAGIGSHEEQDGGPFNGGWGRV